MWQAHYAIHMMRMRELEAAAARRRRWQLEDGWNGRPAAYRQDPGRVRSALARLAASISRASARLAVRLDCRVVTDTRAVPGFTP